MTKKLHLSIVTLFFAFAAFGQTIVNTDVENKKVILEEFTGIHCVFCPDGHAIAKGLQDANPGNVFLINIHAGSYAVPSGNEPDFRTPFGQALANQSQLSGYPAGTINRQNFPGMEQNSNAPGSTALNRGSWANAASQVLPTESYLNMAAEATLDVQTRELEVHIEAYYTGDSPEDSNLLNVALLQNNTLGPQTGGNAGNNYNHQHRLVHLLTGQWGEEITTTTQGTFIDRTYTYTVPAAYNDVEAILADMEIVTFMTETQQLIISGNGTIPAFTGITTANDANIEEIGAIESQCVGTEYVFAPTVTIENLGQETITTLDIEYSINGGTPETFVFNGSILALHSEMIILPETTLTIEAENSISVTIPSDENNDNNSASISFDQAPNSSGTVYMVLNTDNYGSEVRWRVRNSENEIVYLGGPYGNNTTINETFNLDADCYIFELIDTYGDGGGAVTLTDSNGTIIYSTNGAYGSGENTNFKSDGILGVEDNDALQNVVLYPNPANTVLFVRNAKNASLEVYDILGKLIMTESNIALETQLDVANLQTGTYFVKIYGQDGRASTKKFIVAR
ncbi:T9SS type A sorting domain-containing protein [Cochleicola gelatinilyticus]|uniref:Secretion system C-terminal sorting domain-containing protein n=1 Tax=Cochleicola gelatinilyticus TaxID=1763537 RepID=A0A167F2L1_9FLAO|nr:Omp28-related outer membrane protein [Cochleicola gelatinilyticus]OAB76124.1 hypothetical protein ULVI_13795 [Cochleicola gelatinilyticus]